MSWQCVFCDGPVDPTDPYVWHGVHAFERSLRFRSSGKQGGSDITLREPLEEFAHPECILAAKNGVNARQETLV